MLLNRLIEEVFRTDGRRVLAGLARLTGDLDEAEDALQEACVRALGNWRWDGVPDNPGAWLNTVSRRIAIDRRRRDRSAPLQSELESRLKEIEDEPWSATRPKRDTSAAGSLSATAPPDDPAASHRTGTESDNAVATRFAAL